MPMAVEEQAPDGTLRVVRTYRSLSDRTVVASTEQLAGESLVEIPRPIDFPCPELAGEPYPCGGTITTGGPRLISSIRQNWYQGRFSAAFHDGVAWRLGLATIATSRGWPQTMRPILDFRADGVAPMVAYGEMIEPRREGYTVFGVVEELPDGRTLEEVVQEQPLSPADALDIAAQIAAIARRAHAAGHELGGIRPELVYVRQEGTRWSLSAIAHRGQAVIDATYSGEAVRSPDVFVSDFSSLDDAQGLAQLVWYALTGGHPYVARADLQRKEAWSALHRDRASRQVWRGPAALGSVLERVVFDGGDAARFDSLVAGLLRFSESA
jgi:hypothetical protein